MSADLPTPKRGEVWSVHGPNLFKRCLDDEPDFMGCYAFMSIRKRGKVIDLVHPRQLIKKRATSCN